MYLSFSEQLLRVFFSTFFVGKKNLKLHKKAFVNIHLFIFYFFGGGQNRLQLTF